MMKNIKFTKQTTFTGRNGMFKCNGLSILPMHFADKDTVWLEPLTSRNVIGHCHIEIPRADIPKLIAELQSLNIK